jgi:hypothetical protein
MFRVGRQTVGELVSVLFFVSSIAGVAQSSEITIQAVNGKDGRPLAHQRLLVFGGDTAEAASFHRTNFDVTTDGNGVAKMALDRATTRWVEIFVESLTLCYKKPNLVQFRVDKILSDGLSSPNDCGSIVQPAKPGQFIVFARAATLQEKMAR